ncbi:fimbria/pilus outer membrane usher protein [Enterobacteriaceae bacterium 4M9]|nr:fimbria/pilus outer membrane usher protein [Enterobacteriaceae bacterium 4M9]
MKCYGRLFLVITMSMPHSLYARYDFNPELLNSDISSVADLAGFQKGNTLTPGTYKVDVLLNNHYAGSYDIAFFEGNSGLEPCLTPEIISKIGVETSRYDNSVKCILLTQTIPGASMSFTQEKLQLLLSVPQIAIRNAAQGYIAPEFWDDGITAGLLNYNYSGASGRARGKTTENHFLGLSSGINVGPWRLRNQSTWNYSQSGESRHQDWLNINTFLQRPLANLRSTLTLGESSTPNGIYDTLNFTGVQLTSEDAMLPDSLRGFAPVVRGIARTNARVTVKQNSFTVYEAYVPPGPFALNDLYAVGNSGDLLVTITENDGQVISYSLPYSSLPVLQREGQFNYAVTAGHYRGQTGQDSPSFMQATLVAGIPAGISLYGGSQLSNAYQAVTLGIGADMGVIGALSVDATNAKSTLADDSVHHGYAWKLQYAKSLNATGTTFQALGYRYTTDDFYTFSDTTWQRMSGYDQNDDGSVNLDQSYNLNYARKGNVQVSVSQTLGGFGSAYLTGVQQSYWQVDDKTTTVQAGLSATLHDITSTLAVSYNRNPWQNEPDKRVSLMFSVPLTKGYRAHGHNQAWATSGVSYDSKGNTTYSAGVNGNALSDNALSYSVQQSYANNDRAYGGNASVNNKGAYNTLNSAYSYGKDYRQLSAGASGGVIIHADGITFGQPLGDTNVLVDAAGAPGLPVDNRIGVKTDWRGYTYAPYATAYRNNRVALNQTDLPPGITLNDPVVNVVPTKGAIAKASFNAKRGLQVLFTLTQKGKALPLGTVVTLVDADTSSIVGDEGGVFLSGVPEKGTLEAQWGNRLNQKCRVSFDLSNNQTQAFIQKKTLRCD